MEEDPQTKQAVLNTVAKGGRSLRTPMPAAGAAASTSTIATVLSKKAGEAPVPRRSDMPERSRILRQTWPVESQSGMHVPADCAVTAECSLLCAAA